MRVQIEHTMPAKSAWSQSGAAPWIGTSHLNGYLAGRIPRLFSVSPSLPITPLSLDQTNTLQPEFKIAHLLIFLSKINPSATTNHLPSHEDGYHASNNNSIKITQREC